MKSLVKITKLFLGVVAALLVIGMTTTSFASSHYKYRVTRTAFDKVLVGSNNGNGGTSLKQLEKALGHPSLSPVVPLTTFGPRCLSTAGLTMIKTLQQLLS